MNFPNRKKVFAIIVALHANGDSSYRDAKNLSTLVGSKWGYYTVISDKKDMKGLLCRYVTCKKSFLTILAQTVGKFSKEFDILFTLSAHGFSNNKDQYIKVGSDIVLDHEIRDAFYKNMDKHCTSLCLIDTCHSGTMLDLPFKSDYGNVFKKDGTSDRTSIDLSKYKSYCISACDDNELAGEDISMYGGWGGKLVCIFLDYMTDHVELNIKSFFTFVRQIFVNQKNQKSHPIISRT